MKLWRGKARLPSTIYDYQARALSTVQHLCYVLTSTKINEYHISYFLHDRERAWAVLIWALSVASSNQLHTETAMVSWIWWDLNPDLTRQAKAGARKAFIIATLLELSKQPARDCPTSTGCIVSDTYLIIKLFAHYASNFWVSCDRIDGVVNTIYFQYSLLTVSVSVSTCLVQPLANPTLDLQALE